MSNIEQHLVAKAGEMPEPHTWQLQLSCYRLPGQTNYLAARFYASARVEVARAQWPGLSVASRDPGVCAPRLCTAPCCE